ncbi:hypothetical protein [Lederbergia lenta]|uniref:hypothetical protein n=1 Tax=Lederbergia lenta TaxID=1467 RepID=UPI00203C82CD|nr:hypothetical protein [Lederbergia lenta]MCM3109987.1 hypothetical protein [Lederbergia lenta]
MIIKNVRMESAAGHYLGSIECSNEECQPYDRDSLYYPSEDWLKNEFPNSISLKDAYERGMARSIFRRQ